MIIDAHLHCSGAGRSDDVLRSLDDAQSLRRGNEHVARLVRGHGDRLVGFGTLHEAARPIRTNGSAVKAAAAAPR